MAYYTHYDHPICTYDPTQMGGSPEWHNWFGANSVDIIGRFTKGNQDYKNRKDEKIFTHVPDDKLKTNRPGYWIGIQDNNHADKDIYYVSAADCGSNVRKMVKRTSVGDKNHIEKLFQEGGNHTIGFCSDFYGHYSSDNWSQANGFCVYNNFASNRMYPFATKGIAFTFRCAGEDEGLDVWGNSKNFGNRSQIVAMHGLWMDIDENYYIYEMLPNGDNHGKAKVSKLRVPYYNGDPSTTNYYFLRDHCAGNSDYARRDFPGEKEAVKMRVFYNGPEVEDKFFMGFSMCIKIDGGSGGSKHAHTHQISNVMPIPFYSPRPPMKTRHEAVMGGRTEIDELRNNGGANILKWAFRQTSDKFTYDGTTYIPNGKVPGYDAEGDQWDEPVNENPNDTIEAPG